MRSNCGAWNGNELGSTNGLVGGGGAAGGGTGLSIMEQAASANIAAVRLSVRIRFIAESPQDSGGDCDCRVRFGADNTGRGTALSSRKIDERSFPLVENDGPPAVQKDSVFGVPLHGARQHDGFKVTACRHQVLDRERMRHAIYGLLDDRPFVEVLRYIMRGGPDQLDAALMGLLIGPGAFETGQE